MYDFNITLSVHPIFQPGYHEPPMIQYGSGSRVISKCMVEDIINLEFSGTENYIWIEFLNKDPRKDTVIDKGWDKALEIKKINVQGFTNTPLQYLGVYQERYTNYLSFNGRWQYEFELPIFTWIHKTCNFGWIFD